MLILVQVPDVQQPIFVVPFDFIQNPAPGIAVSPTLPGYFKEIPPELRATAITPWLSIVKAPTVSCLSQSSSWPLSNSIWLWCRCNAIGDTRGLDISFRWPKVVRPHSIAFSKAPLPTRILKMHIQELIKNIYTGGTSLGRELDFCSLRIAWATSIGFLTSIYRKRVMKAREVMWITRHGTYTRKKPGSSVHDRCITFY